MPVVHVSHADDPRLAPYVLLKEPQALRKAGWLIAESRIVVERLLAEPRFEVASLLVSQSALRALAPVLEARPALDVYVCETRLFEDLTGYDFHRGCLALARRPAPPSLGQLLAASRFLVVLERVANADNVGGVFRNAAAFGVDAVLLDARSADPWYRKAIRTSMGHSLRVPFAQLVTEEQAWPESLALLAAHGFERVALTPSRAAEPLEEYSARREPGRRCALLLGAEGDGLTPEALRHVERRLYISMRRGVDSLNLAVASGIALHHLAARDPGQGL